MKIIKPNYNKIEKAINKWLKENEVTVINSDFRGYGTKEEHLIKLFNEISDIINFGIESVQNDDMYWIQTYYYSDKISKLIILDSPKKLIFENIEEIINYIKEQEESIINIESRIK